uniref:Cuticlin-1 n=1 Tax=Ascaris suum TaxID=6253 RepID=F1LCJ6_ASCSU
MEADKTVTYPLTVSMRSLEPFTELAEMPRCQYEVVDPLTMEPLSVVSVGNKLLHKWTCDSTAPSLWCMTVHSCFVEDGSGTQFVILDDNGCAIATDTFLTILSMDPATCRLRRKHMRSSLQIVLSSTSNARSDLTSATENAPDRNAET